MRIVPRKKKHDHILLVVSTYGNAIPESTYVYSSMTVEEALYLLNDEIYKDMPQNRTVSVFTSTAPIEYEEIVECLDEYMLNVHVQGA